jgi:hypothetical protein
LVNPSLIVGLGSVDVVIVFDFLGGKMDLVGADPATAAKTAHLYLGAPAVLAAALAKGVNGFHRFQAHRADRWHAHVISLALQWPSGVTV